MYENLYSISNFSIIYNIISISIENITSIICKYFQDSLQIAKRNDVYCKRICLIIYLYYSIIANMCTYINIYIYILEFRYVP